MKPINAYVQTLAHIKFGRERTCSGWCDGHDNNIDDRWQYTTLATCDGELSVFVSYPSPERLQFTVEIPGGATAGLGTAPRFAGACDGNNGCGGWVPVVPLRPAGRNHDTDDGPSGSE